MNTTLKITKYEFNDVIRSKWVILYTVLFFLISDSLLRFGGENTRVMLSLMNVILIVIPLVSIIFGNLYLYNSREFIELLLSQPIDRKHLYIGMYSGVAVPLTAGFVIGITLPFVYFGISNVREIQSLMILLVVGVLLTVLFLALAFLISVLNQDRVKGLGFSILLWLFFSVIYDGSLLLFIYTFSDYPLEKALLILSMLNPVDLGRIAILIHFDISALMGYTGAVFQDFFGTSAGLLISFAVMIIWIITPFYLGLKKFIRKDF